MNDDSNMRDHAKLVRKYVRELVWTMPNSPQARAIIDEIEAAGLLNDVRVILSMEAEMYDAHNRILRSEQLSREHPAAPVHRLTP